MFSGQLFFSLTVRIDQIKLAKMNQPSHFPLSITHFTWTCQTISCNWFRHRIISKKPGQIKPNLICMAEKNPYENKQQQQRQNSLCSGSFLLVCLEVFFQSKQQILVYRKCGVYDGKIISHIPEQERVRGRKRQTEGGREGEKITELTLCQRRNHSVLSHFFTESDTQCRLKCVVKSQTEKEEQSLTNDARVSRFYFS